MQSEYSKAGSIRSTRMDIFTLFFSVEYSKCKKTHADRILWTFSPGSALELKEQNQVQDCSSRVWKIIFLLDTAIPAIPSKISGLCFEVFVPMPTWDDEVYKVVFCQLA